MTYPVNCKLVVNKLSLRYCLMMENTPVDFFDKYIMGTYCRPEGGAFLYDLLYIKRLCVLPVGRDAASRVHVHSQRQLVRLPFHKQSWGTRLPTVQNINSFHRPFYRPHFVGYEKVIFTIVCPWEWGGGGGVHIVWHHTQLPLVDRVTVPLCTVGHHTGANSYNDTPSSGYHHSRRSIL